jgi:hypothetical protein
VQVTRFEPTAYFHGVYTRNFQLRVWKATVAD